LECPRREKNGLEHPVLHIVLQQRPVGGAAPEKKARI
jgi:hypothetical protein